MIPENANTERARLPTATHNCPPSASCTRSPAVVVPAGTNHNIINTGGAPLKLYTLYAPPNHRDGVVHHTRDAAEADNEHYDGNTTE